MACLFRLKQGFVHDIKIKQPLLSNFVDLASSVDSCLHVVGLFFEQSSQLLGEQFALVAVTDEVVGQLCYAHLLVFK